MAHPHPSLISVTLWEDCALGVEISQANKEFIINLVHLFHVAQCLLAILLTDLVMVSSVNKFCRPESSSCLYIYLILILPGFVNPSCHSEKTRGKCSL